MKILCRIIVVASIIFMTIQASAQSCSGILSSNIGLFLPPHNCQAWDIPLNQNFSALDLFLSGNNQLPSLWLSGLLTLTPMTVASLPVSPRLGSEAYVSDPQDQFDCSVGGGTGFLHKCIYVNGYWGSEPPRPSLTSAGIVQQKNCSGSAIQSINSDSTVSCAASPSGGNGVIYQSGGTGAVVGDGTYKTLYTYTLVGGTLSSVGGLRVTCYLGNVTGTGYPTSSFAFNSTVVPTLGFNPSSYGVQKTQIVWMNNGATNSQWDLAENYTVIPTWLNGNTSTSVDTTGNVIITCQAKKSDGTFVGNGFIVERIAQ